MIALAPSQEFTRLASADQIATTVRALEANRIHAIVVDTGEQARARVLGMIPAGVEVYNPPSRTLELIGLAQDIESASVFQPVRSRLRALNRETHAREMRRLTASPDVVVGSVQAVTEQGQVLLASASGSQMSSAVAGATSVIWVVGTQKLVPNLDEGLRRIREYSYPLEDERTRLAYGRPSAINKILIVNGKTPGRITIVLVKENLGF